MIQQTVPVYVPPGYPGSNNHAYAYHMTAAGSQVLYPSPLVKEESTFSRNWIGTFLSVFTLILVPLYLSTMVWINLIRFMAIPILGIPAVQFIRPLVMTIAEIFALIEGIRTVISLKYFISSPRLCLLNAAVFYLLAYFFLIVQLFSDGLTELIPSTTWLLAVGLARLLIWKSLAADSDCWYSFCQPYKPANEKCNVTV